MHFNAVVMTWGRIFKSLCSGHLKAREGPRVGAAGATGAGWSLSPAPRSAVGASARGAPRPHVRDGPEVNLAVSCPSLREPPREEVASRAGKLRLSGPVITAPFE